MWTLPAPRPSSPSHLRPSLEASLVLPHPKPPRVRSRAPRFSLTRNSHLFPSLLAASLAVLGSESRSSHPLSLPASPHFRLSRLRSGHSGPMSSHSPSVSSSPISPRFSLVGLGTFLLCWGSPPLGSPCLVLASRVPQPGLHNGEPGEWSAGSGPQSWLQWTGLGRTAQGGQPGGGATGSLNGGPRPPEANYPRQPAETKERPSPGAPVRRLGAEPPA